MNKIELKSNMKQVEKDVKYYVEEYGLNQKEAYEEVYKRYYYRLRIIQDKVEIEAREKIHNEFKEGVKWNKELDKWFINQIRVNLQ